ncbi:DUF3859 domain-containing protein [Paraglaciecola hydrolytica]|uniref:DUF3859 domain-containing protein n=1 Tax=Paraglaciecola hydrolytica TaxID=1799789 RepID=A0A136A4V0_9ALTE|nr:DUF3859 domain-containing protein [Paraglaciecola hydrolytica]KXI30249.1 hypothetical protein AX660_09710 [Paraglaciecola hydrolytica]
MAKLKANFSISSFGIYQEWDEKAKQLPVIKDFTTHIPAQLDIEFGFILHVLKGKGLKLDYTIYHPNIPDKKGEIMEPFRGEVYVRNNDWEFYLGDTLWEPIENKTGDWRMVIELNGKIIAEKTFSVLVEYGDGEIQFWKKRGY